jgi:predicted RNA-binding protein with PIN domain
MVDGYNALITVKPLLKSKFKSRDGFLQYIKIAQPFGSLRNKITIVFDGRKGIVSSVKKRYSPLNIIYAKHRTADEQIVQMVKKELRPQQTIVVTDDRELREKVRALGAQIMSVREFFKSLKKKSPAQEEKPRPESAEGKAITETMKKEWGIDE